MQCIHYHLSHAIYSLSFKSFSMERMSPSRYTSISRNFLKRTARPGKRGSLMTICWALAICLALTILLSQLSALFVLRCVVCVCMYVCMCRCVRMRVAPTCRRHCLRASAHVAGTLSSARRAEVLQVLLYAASCRHCL